MKKAFVFLLFFLLMFNILKVNANEVSNEDVNNDVIELLDRTKTRYHYDYLGTLEYGEYYQEIYNQLDSVLREYMLHDVSANIEFKVSDELNEIYSDYYDLRGKSWCLSLVLPFSSLFRVLFYSLYYNWHQC